MRDGARCDENTFLPSIINFDIANSWCEFKAGVLNFFVLQDWTPIFTIRQLLLKELGHLANKRSQVIGWHFWRERPQENERRTVIGLFRERNVCRFEAATWDGERCVTLARAAAKETTSTETWFEFGNVLFNVALEVFMSCLDISEWKASLTKSTICKMLMIAVMIVNTRQNA